MKQQEFSLQHTHAKQENKTRLLVSTKKEGGSRFEATPIYSIPWSFGRGFGS